VIQKENFKFQNEKFSVPMLPVIQISIAALKTAEIPVHSSPAQSAGVTP
jgi:hypothetical protein